MTAEDRLNHCVKTHKLPKDFRFDQKPKQKNRNKKNQHSMDIDKESSQKERKFTFNNNKQIGFKKFFIKKFTNDEQNSTASVNLDEVMADIKDNLPT